MPPSYISRVFCPQCEDLIIAATKSQHVSANEVWHWWVCEACGHEFRTAVRLQSSPRQSVRFSWSRPQSLRGPRSC